MAVAGIFLEKKDMKTCCLIRTTVVGVLHDFFTLGITISVSLLHDDDDDEPCSSFPIFIPGVGFFCLLVDLDGYHRHMVSA